MDDKIPIHLVPFPLPTVEFPCFEVILKRHSLQFAQEVSRPLLLFHGVGGGFKAESPSSRTICKHLTFFWIVWPPLVTVVFRKRWKSPSWKKVPCHFVGQNLSSVSTPRFLFSSLEKYVMSVYIRVIRTVRGVGQAEARACVTCWVTHVLHLPACLSFTWDLSVMCQKIVWKDSHLLRLPSTRLWFIFLTSLFL